MQGGKNRTPANDRTALPETVPQPDPQTPYSFEICRDGPRSILIWPKPPEKWLWRMVSPEGSTLIECTGYRDEESCRAAVALLRDKAATALIKPA